MQIAEIVFNRKKTALSDESSQRQSFFYFKDAGLSRRFADFTEILLSSF